MMLSDLSIRRPVLATMVSAALVLFGIIGYQRLSVREFPDVDPPVISVSTTLRGANPQVMESAVTDVLEEELATLEGLRTMVSSSGEQSSNITLEFTLDRDVESAAQDVRDKVSRVRRRLPFDVDEPVVTKQDADAEAFMFLALTSETIDPLRLTEIADRDVRERLQGLPGVARAELRGGRRYSMRVWLDAAQLAARGLTTGDVVGAIRTRSVEVPAGRIESTNREFSVRSLGELRTPDEFAELVVSTANGALVKLRDVARVEYGPENERTLVRYNGTPAVGVGIIRQSKANLLDVSDEVNRAVPEIQEQLPAGVTLQVSFDQQARFVKRSITEAQETLVIAAVLVVLIIFVFLRNLRATIIPALAIPASIVSTFALMYFLGFSINNFTLLALTLAIGIVVDDAIIVLENAFRHQEELGEDPETAATLGTREIGFAVIATTASLIAVFIPVAFLRGNTGRLFNEFAIAVAASVFLSGFVALTLTPMLCAKLLRVPPSHGLLYRALEAAFDAMTRGYQRLLAASLRHPLAIIALALATLVAAVGTFGTLKREFVPAEDRGFLTTNVLAPEGSTLRYTDQYMRQVEQIYRTTKDIRSYYAFIGRGGGPANSGFIFVRLADFEQRSRSAPDVLGEIRPKLAQVAGVLAFASQPPAFASGGGFGQPVQFIVRNPDFAKLQQGIDSMVRRGRRVKGLLNVDTDLRVNKPELNVEFDRDRAEDLGVAVNDIAGTLQTMLGGLRAASFTRQNKLYDVLVQLSPESRATPQDMSGLFVRGRAGELVQLSAVTRVRETVGPRALTHYSRVRSATLSAALAPGFTLGEALDSLNRIAKDVLPAGSTIAYGGEAREFMESGGELYFAFGLALLVVFMVLASQFESLVHPFTVLLAVPLAVCGAIFTLKLADATINLYSQIGMILLVGIVTKNAILLVEYTNQLRERGQEVVAALMEAGRIRLRPIVMTSVATIMGAVPIALGLGAGATSRRPLGYAIVGGVFFSTLLTLFLVPSVYLLIERLRGRRAVPVAEPAIAGAGLAPSDPPAA
ncbi:MAG: efflux RND transporter permease subunit [Gemmatimonadales bacterium]|nr:efflux RND transporter permease subunit [Gemmatimonadales bacterium]